MRRTAALPFLTLALASGASGCGGGTEPSAPPPETAAPWFVESAAERGLDFVHVSGAAAEDTEYLMPEIMSGGAALLDMDGDGDLDAYLVQSGGVRTPPDERPPNALFENDGTGRFADVTAGSGAGDRGLGMGVACADADGDGDPELYVTNLGPNVLLSNEGGGRFRDVTDAAGAGHPGWSTSAAFLDHDRDGDLDLYVASYVAWSLAGELACSNDMGSADYCSPTSYEAPALDVLLVNDGDGGFADASERSGVASKAAYGLGVACGDFDADGWLDVFVANDQDPDFLWRNAGDGTFADDAFRAGCALDLDGRAKAGMGVDAADVDHDGDLDLIVCNLNRESDSYFVNRGGRFHDHTSRAGLARASRPFTRFGMGWEDFDQDGLHDLYQANGRVMKLSPRYETGGADDWYAEPNLLMQGVERDDGSVGFAEVEPRGGTAGPLVATSRAAAFGDVDGDGGVDVLVVNRDAPVHLLLNRVPDRGGWIGVRVVDAAGADVLHATVVVALPDGSTRRRDVRTARSYLASSSPVAHVGLGDLGEDPGTVDVTVELPGGRARTFRGLATGRVHVLDAPER